MLTEVNGKNDVGVEDGTFEGHLEGEFHLKQVRALGNRSRKSASHHPKYLQILQYQLVSQSQTPLLCSVERNNPGNRYLWVKVTNRD